MSSASLQNLRRQSRQLSPPGDGWRVDRALWCSERSLMQAAVRRADEIHRALVRVDGASLRWDCSCGNAACTAFVAAIDALEDSASRPAAAPRQSAAPGRTRLYYRLFATDETLQVECHVGTAPADDLPRLAPARGLDASRPRFVADDDLPILAHLEEHDGRLLAAECLQQLAATERAHLDALAGTPIQWGGIVEGDLAWELLIDGSQRLAVKLSGDLELISRDPLLAADEAQRVYAVDCGIPPAQWSQIQAAVPMDQLAQSWDSGPLSALQHALPVPFRPGSIEQAHDAPQRRLRIERRDGRTTARLELVYGGRCIAAATEIDPVAERDGPVLRWHHRDWVAEAAALGTMRRSSWSGGPAQWYLPGSLAMLARFMLQEQPDLEAEGWEIIHGPGCPGIDFVPADRLRLKIAEDSALLQAAGGGENLLRSGPVLVAGAYVLIETGLGQVVALPRTLLQDVQLALGERHRPSRASLAALPLEVEDESGHAAADHARLLAADIPLPQTLKAQLRDYQRNGFHWLARLDQAGFGGILADDMGLGKTVQALAFLCSAYEREPDAPPSLIVAPVSVLDNWRTEARRFAPALKLVVHHGSDRRQQRWGSTRLVLTTYALLRQEQALFAGRPWRAVILDEAQAIKNAGSATARAARSLDCRFRAALTGTPMENHLGELWALFRFAEPGLLGSEREFDKLFRTPVQDGDDERRAALVRRIAPFMLRRTREQVLGELPPLVESELRIELGTEQRALYESVRAAASRDLSELAEDADEISRRGRVLQIITRLRQACCAPQLLPSEFPLREAPSAKLAALDEMLQELVAEDRYVLVFSQFRGLLAAARERLTQSGTPSLLLTGQTRDRGPLIQRFQAGEAPVFFIGLKAGGTGLNLTRADTVILLDPWWNPAVEQQAAARAHRIGQQSTVFVYRLIAADTIEDRIQSMKERKRQLGDGLARAVETLDLSDPAVLEELLADDAV